MTPDPASGFADGVRAGLPVVLGYLSIGFAAGVVQRASGLSVAEVMLMSLVLYAGSAQFVAASMIAAASPAPAVIATVFFVNLRHLLLSAALAPYFARVTAWKNALLGAQLTDETFVVALNRLRAAPAGVAARAGEGAQARSGVAFAWMAGLNLSAYASWAAANLAGALAGGLVSHTRALAFDFALPAMFGALLVLQFAAQASRRRALAVAVAAGALSIGVALALPGNWNIMIATVTGASLGAALEVMFVRTDVLLIVLGTALVTVVPRVAPLALLSHVDLPRWLKVWLGYVPVAVLGALLAGELFVPAGRLVPLSSNTALLAVVPAIAVAARFGSIIGAVVAGVAAMAALRALGRLTRRAQQRAIPPRQE